MAPPKATQTKPALFFDDYGDGAETFAMVDCAKLCATADDRPVDLVASAEDCSQSVEMGEVSQPSSAR